MFAENATEWFERTWTKYSFLIGTQNGSMKAEDRWKRYDMTPQLLQGEVDDYLKLSTPTHASAMDPNSGGWSCSSGIAGIESDRSSSTDVAAGRLTGT